MNLLFDLAHGQCVLILIHYWGVAQGIHYLLPPEGPDHYLLDAEHLVDLEEVVFSHVAHRVTDQSELAVPRLPLDHL